MPEDTPLLSDEADHDVAVHATYRRLIAETRERANHLAEHAYRMIDAGMFQDVSGSIGISLADHAALVEEKVQPAPETDIPVPRRSAFDPPWLPEVASVEKVVAILKTYAAYTKESAIPAPTIKNELGQYPSKLLYHYQLGKGRQGIRGRWVQDHIQTADQLWWLEYRQKES